MTAAPIAFDAVLDEDGRLQVPDDAAARLAALGAGSKVHVEATPAPAKRTFKPTLGVLAHLRDELDVDMLEVRRDMAEEFRRSGMSE
ncbi:MAG: hypothetical protein LBQ06_03750 [Frankiaceae bacterium]|jgi:hypothetical protein|nr:hypothetical protein [Frankiaceae bacterium]